MSSGLNTMVRKVTGLTLTILSLMIPSYVSGQKAELDTLIKKFNQYRSTRSTEKIYARLDQQLYLTGETLWFKLYLVDGAIHAPSEISKVAYIEILDKSNRPVLQSKVALNDGYGNGSLFIPAVIEGGNYTFRAYTSWMRNSGPDYYFHTNITIINTFKKLDLEKATTSSTKVDAQFFPEGGNLVYGLKSKVSFKVTDSRGKGIAFKGALMDQNNDTVSVFRPLRFGMGSFDFTPVQGNVYQAVVEDEKGQRNTFKLPAILESGYVMRLSDSTDNHLSLSVDSRLPAPQATPVVYVFVHARNIISQATVNFLQQGKATIMIPKKDLQDGISHITIFDAQLRPVCERLYFTPVKKKLTIDVQANQREYGIRRKVSLDINVQNASQTPAASNLSVVVYRTDSLTQVTDGSLFSYLWLNSDLNGTIESPEYYVNQNDPEVRLTLENVMLTHGWRRFVWSDVLEKSNAAILFPPEYRGHIIKGKVSRPDGGSVNGIWTYLSAPGRNIQSYGSASNAEGNVQYEMKDFYGSKKIIAQTNTTRDSISRIQILSPFSDNFSNFSLPPFSFPPSLEQQLIARSIGMQVQDIFFQDQNNPYKNAAVDTTAFYGKADATYYLDDYTRFPVMEEILREYVPGVFVRKRKDGFHFMLLDNVNKRVFDEDPWILLDGLPIFDADVIMSYDPLKVKKLEVMTRRYYMGVISMPGIVSFTTYGGDLEGFQLNPRSVSLDYEGLQLQREFYSPKYDTPKQRDSRLPDQRNVLYWAPAVITDSNGKQQVEFYTSDLVGEYNVSIEGLSKDGSAGSGSGTFSVRPYEN